MSRQDWCLKSNCVVIPHNKRIVSLIGIEAGLVRASFGRPIKKASRVGKRGLNRLGHRSNPYKKN